MFKILAWELSRRKAYIFWWTFGVSLLIAVTILSYLAIKDQSAQLDQAMGSMTSSLGGFFGTNDFFSPEGYLSSQIYYIMLPILLIILVLNLASGLMNKVESDGTLEVTLAQPISRSKVMLGKLFAAISVLVIIAVVSFFVTYFCAKIVGLETGTNNLIVTHFLTFAFSASFGMISFSLMAMSNITKKIANIVAIVISFGGYIVISLSSFVSQLEFSAKFMPYKYFNSGELLTGNVDKGLVIYLIGIFILGLVASFIGYNKRDIG